MFEIRKATIDDYKGICRLITTKEELFLIYPKGTFPFTIDQLEDIAGQRKSLTVMFDGEQVIGFANLYDYKRGEFAFIGNVVIAQKYRGKGMGKRLVSHMLEVAQTEYALPEIRISVFSDNARALLLYSSFGFSPYAIEERVNPAEQRVALIHLSKKIR